MNIMEFHGRFQYLQKKRRRNQPAIRYWLASTGRLEPLRIRQIGLSMQDTTQWYMGDDGLYQVRVGNYDTIEDAIIAQRELRDRGYDTLIVRKM